MKSRIIASALLLATPILHGAHFDQKESHEAAPANISREVLRKFDKGDDVIIQWIDEKAAHKNAVQNFRSDGTTLLMLSILLGKKNVIDHLLNIGANTRALTTKLDLTTKQEDALDILIHASGLKTPAENIAVATKLVDTMIAQGVTIEQLLHRLNQLNKNLYHQVDTLKKEIADRTFLTNGEYKKQLKNVEKKLLITEAIIKHLAQKETTRRDSIKK